jgi:hypothetical protein
MPHCYGIILSLASSVDRKTQLWNVQGLLDAIHTRKLPITLPVEMHVYWAFAPDELGTSYDARLVLTVESTRFAPSEPLRFRGDTPYTHLRLRGVALDREGEYHASIEWRRTGTREWTRTEVFWPFVVSLEQDTA